MEKKVKQGKLSLACVCLVLGFMISLQFRTTEGLKSSVDNVSVQRVEELTERLNLLTEERDALKAKLKNEATDPEEEELCELAQLTAMTGPGVIVKLDDSNREVKSGENPNLYVIHDDDLLKVINELRAAGAEAISINGQRLTALSEVRCAGPTLSVNNVRSAAPFEVKAIGDKHNLENALKMRGGVEDALKVWGIQMNILAAEEVYVPPYRGRRNFDYARPAATREADS